MHRSRSCKRPVDLWRTERPNCHRSCRFDVRTRPCTFCSRTHFVFGVLLTNRSARRVRRSFLRSKTSQMHSTVFMLLFLGILRPMLIVLEIPDFQLQHLTLRALHTICVHPVALGNLVNYGAIPFLCHFLGIGLSQHQGTRIIRAASFGYNHGCISRKRGPSSQSLSQKRFFSGDDFDDASRNRSFESS